MFIKSADESLLDFKQFCFWFRRPNDLFLNILLSILKPFAASSCDRGQDKGGNLC
ncbi:hypothetical protein J2T37_000437 [Neisseria perflava]|nr:hypothetical protein [Neisseria perflava]